ncbi:MAG: CPBP family intramembrane glutamic endopeptidase [Actinomycetes bacterium]
MSQAEERTERPGRLDLPGRRLLVAEIVLVFALSLGADGVRAVLYLVGALTARVALARQQAVLVGTYAPGRPLLDLAFQLLGIATALVPVALVLYLLHRSGERAADIGLDASRPGKDALWGAGLAALVGGTGLVFYVGARLAGVSLTIVPESLPAVWWRVPVLVLAAVQDGLLEETLVVGYLLRRLRQLGWSDRTALATSAVLRGSYHLYQGFGAFIGNAAMGLLFGRIYQRTGRTTPLVIAHSLIDAVAFVGYVYLHGKVSWLP